MTATPPPGAPLQAVWSGTATAGSSIAHGGDTLGTVQYLRRERVLTSSGVQRIPVISGNALRGVLRGVSAALTWDDLGRPDLPLHVAHFLWSGGALVKAKGERLSGAPLAALRAALPHVEVFGGATSGRILDGALAVGKVVPLCRQTRDLLPHRTHCDTDVDIHDLTQIEEYSRNAPDMPTDPMGGAHHELGHPPASDHDTPVPTHPGTPMRFGVETFIAGCRFDLHLTLRHPSAAAIHHMDRVLDAWNSHPVIGGGSSRGHGTLLTRWETRPTDIMAPRLTTDPGTAVALLRDLT